MNRQAEEAAEMAEQLHNQMFTNNEQAENVNNETAEEEPEQTEDTSEETVSQDEEDIEELRKYKARYNSLKGMYEKQVPELQNELKEFKAKVFEDLYNSTKKTEEPKQEPVEDKFSKFKEEYGEDLFEAIRALAAEQAEEKLKSSLKPVQEQVSSVEDTQIKAAQQNFVSYLDTQVKGDWKNLWAGNDPKFIEFLSQPDPSGLYTYGDLVQAYNDNWDADRLGKVFNTYFESNAPKQKQPNPSQQAIVAPSRQNTHSTPSANDAKIWTKQAMDEFQANDRAGRYTPEESKALWDDLLAAPAQNRMR